MNVKANARASSSLARDARLSYGDPSSENMLVHADNARALVQLRDRFVGKFRCIYLDPPFNTGRTFAEYDDALSTHAWREMMRARIDLLVPLLADDGSIVVEIDDTELGPLLMMMDAAFGRENRIATVTVVRSASTGHKAKNAGPVNVADYILIYAKDRARFRATPQHKVRRGHDRAYSTYLANPNDAPRAWTFEPLAKVVANSIGHASSAKAAKALGRDAFHREVASFAIAHAENVVRFAQPRFEAVSQEAQRAILESKNDPARVIALDRKGFRPMILRAGNRLLFLSDKVRTTREGRSIVEPLTNVWDDVPFQGIAKEGGVVFSRNKKPERLLARVLDMTTDVGDWVLDPFLGSGTTAAVAHKMKRRWVGIEQGAHFHAMCLPRLQRVVDGEDKAGITREREFEGGGGFGVYA